MELGTIITLAIGVGAGSFVGFLAGWFNHQHFEAKNTKEHEDYLQGLRDKIQGAMDSIVKLGNHSRYTIKDKSSLRELEYSQTLSRLLRDRESRAMVMDPYGLYTEAMVHELTNTRIIQRNGWNIRVAYLQAPNCPTVLDIAPSDEDTTQHMWALLADDLAEDQPEADAEETPVKKKK